jgi:hypothetical protein
MVNSCLSTLEHMDLFLELSYAQLDEQILARSPSRKPLLPFHLSTLLKRKPISFHIILAPILLTAPMGIGVVG